MIKRLTPLIRILASNATFLVAFLGLVLLGGGVTMRFGTDSALIVVGALGLADAFFETWGGPRVR